MVTKGTANSLSALVDASLVIEKLRVASQVGISHLALQGRVDPDREELYRRLADLESFVDGRVAERIQEHPAYPWFSRVKGVGKENIGKVIYAIRVQPEYDEEGNELPYADTISAVWKFAGFSVEDGKAPRREKGAKTTYNSRLRTMCWRLGESLMRAQGKFYDYYVAQKAQYVARYQAEGKKIVPATALPKVNGKKQETDSYISEGHIHNMALRKMIKLFLALLWISWRTELGLPVREPYSSEKLGHTHVYKPEDFVDRATGDKKPRKSKRARNRE